MEYLSGYFLHQENPVISLVLKHLVYHGNREPVLLGCLYTGREVHGTAPFIERLTERFYREGVSLCSRNNVTPERLQAWLQEIQYEWEQETQTAVRGACDTMLLQERGQEFPWESVSVVICVGKYFALWNCGEQQIILLNTRFGRPNVRSIGKAGEETLVCGEAEGEVGILLGSADFCQKVSRLQMAGCLAVEELQHEERIQKRLKELGEEALRKGGKHVAAMLVKLC